MGTATGGGVAQQRHGARLSSWQAAVQPTLREVGERLRTASASTAMTTGPMHGAATFAAAQLERRAEPRRRWRISAQMRFQRFVVSRLSPASPSSMSLAIARLLLCSAGGARRPIRCACRRRLRVRDAGHHRAVAFDPWASRRRGTALERRHAHTSRARGRRVYHARTRCIHTRAPCSARAIFHSHCSRTQFSPAPPPAAPPRAVILGKVGARPRRDARGARLRRRRALPPAVGRQVGAVVHRVAGDAADWMPLVGLVIAIHELIQSSRSTAPSAARSSRSAPTTRAATSAGTRSASSRPTPPLSRRCRRRRSTTAASR